MMRCAALALGLLMSGQVFAQSSGVPPELLNNSRRQSGDAIAVCLEASSPARLFERDVAQAIGDALFLKVSFQEGFSGFPLDGAGFMDELLVAMSNSCDIFMGISVQVNSPFPDWAVITRPYATIPFVLAVKEPEWQKLGDIPKDRLIGTALQSAGEMAYISWSQQQPKSQRWQRLPYADPDLMLKRVLDGRLAGMLLWQPSLAQLQRDNPDAAQVRVISTEPAPQAVVRLGALLSSRDSFLRTQIDQAIDALVADGTIAGLMQSHGFTGTSGD